MTARDKFIVVALLGLMVVVSVATVALDPRDVPALPTFGGTYVEGVTGPAQYNVFTGWIDGNGNPA